MVRSSEQLDQWLNKDIGRSQTIQKTNTGITISHTGQTVRYEFAPDMIVRVSAITDTFVVKADAYHTLFEGQPVDEAGSPGEESLLDEISFTVNYHNETIPYHYYKTYSSASLIQINAYANH